MRLYVEKTCQFEIITSLNNLCYTFWLYRLNNQRQFYNGCNFYNRGWLNINLLFVFPLITNFRQQYDIFLIMSVGTEVKSS